MCPPERLRFKFLIPVDTQLYRGGDIQLRQKRFLLLIAVDIQVRSSRHGYVVQNGIALSFRSRLIYSCARYAPAVLITVDVPRC